MAGTSKKNDSENMKVIIGKLIEKADQIIRPVISVFDCFQTRQTNIQKLNKFNVPPLESCAEFLGISLVDKEGNKLFVKSSLVDRIYLGLMALMPAKCGECSDEYTIDHDPEHPPFFSCFRCFKGSHDCERNRELHQTLSTMNTPSGFVWLCDTCHAIVDPIEPRKQRSRLTSTSGNSTPSGNQILDNSSNLSNIVLKGVLSSTNNASSQAVNSTSTNSVTSETNISETRSSVGICPRFLDWKCPHGISGKKQIDGICCSLRHLRVCNQFRMSGSTGRKGCKKGKNCSFFHPEICNTLSSTGSCVKKGCSKFHPHSSRRKDDDNRSRVPRKSDTNQKVKVKVGKDNSHRNRDSTDFLELRNLVTGMAAKLESLEKKVDQSAQSYQPAQHAPSPMLYRALAPPAVMPLGVPRLHQPHFPYTHQSYY